MNNKQNRFFLVLVPKSGSDYKLAPYIIMKVSPYSKQTEKQRLDELKCNVNKAKEALETFSYKKPPHNFFDKFKKYF